MPPTLVRRSHLLGLLLLILLADDLSLAQGQAGSSRAAVRPSARRVPNQYIVTVNDNASIDGVATDTVRTRGGRLRRIYRNAVRGFAVELSAVEANALAADPRVAYVQEDGVFEVTVDSQSTHEWNLDRIDQRGGAADGVYRYSGEGVGVHVYVIDTGIQVTHVDFEGRAVDGVSFAGDGERSDRDCHGHGTHVAGIVGGAQSGVAKNVTLHSVRTQRCDGLGWGSDIVAGIDWIIANHVKPAVINMSLGGVSIDSALDDAIERATGAGILFVAAAGNANADACATTPGSAAAAVIVGSVGSSDSRAGYSNFGRCLDLFAPGDGIRSAAAWNDNEYVAMSGTSMASPHVAGAAALYLQRHPLASPSEVTRAIVSGATRDVVKDAGTSSPNLLLFSLHLGDVVPPAVTLLTPIRGAEVSGAVGLSATASDDVEVSKVDFFAGGTFLGTDRSAPYAFTWNTAALTNGTYGVRADATDTAGNVTQGSSTTVTVRNGSASGSTWTSTRVGASTAGTASYANGVFTVSAAGTDVWGTADAFELVSRGWSGDVDLVARVSALTKPAGAAFSLAGLTLRTSTAADAAHVSLVITTDGKVKLRRRLTTGAATLSDGPAAGSVYPPRWLKLTRRGNAFAGFYSSDGVAWTLAAGPYTVALPVSLRVGLLALRQGGTDVATATFRNVSIGSLPAGWANVDIGNTGRLGATKWGSQQVRLDAGGTDLWSTADAFHFVYRRWTGDGTFVTRIDSLIRPADGVLALAALMIRESLTPGSKHASLMISSDGKAKFRRRAAVGGTTASDGPSAGSVVVPVWLKLTRRGTMVSAFTSTDGVSWRPVHTAQAVAMSGTVYVGVAGVGAGGNNLAAVTFTPVTTSVQ
jgi:subtilisin family serine protease